MSDCAEQYYNSWIDVFGPNSTRKLLCIWHVDRAWRNGLHVGEIDSSNKIEKVTPFLDKLLPIIQQNYTPSQQIAIDESMSICCRSHWRCRRI
jgi:lipopolysaccharide biosynthesis regulator YciM